MKILNVVKIGKLVVKYLRVEGNLCVHAELIIGQENQMFAVLALDFHLVLHHVEIFLCLLLLQSHLLNLLHKGQCASVEDGHFGTIQLNEAVVDAAGIKRCHSVFDGAYLDVAFHKNGATLGVTYQISIAIDNWLTFNICSLNLVSEVLFCRVEHRRDELTSVQTLTFQGERFLQSLLFLHLFVVFDFFNFFFQGSNLFQQFGQ